MSTVSSASDVMTDVDKERIDNGLAKELKDAGVDADIVDRLIRLLHECSVTTRGALRMFADDVPALIKQMFEGQAMGELKAKGLLASVRVRICALTPCPGSNTP